MGNDSFQLSEFHRAFLPGTYSKITGIDVVVRNHMFLRRKNAMWDRVTVNSISDQEANQIPAIPGACISLKGTR
jgi:hypothetical protein